MSYSASRRAEGRWNHDRLNRAPAHSPLYLCGVWEQQPHGSPGQVTRVGPPAPCATMVSFPTYIGHEAAAFHASFTGFKAQEGAFHSVIMINFINGAQNISPASPPCLRWRVCVILTALSTGSKQQLTIRAILFTGKGPSTKVELEKHDPNNKTLHWWLHQLAIFSEPNTFICLRR